ncbi:MAG: VIT family protein [Gemmatimonadota bacterium]|nr:VIT family protein [Gemmatimonadota bacterium]
MIHIEGHRSNHIGWLRAAVMGANDGILSTSSIVVGVAAANATRHNVLLAGAAGLVAGAMSMAAGEYVSVSSQSDTENADLARERQELETQYDVEREELALIYQGRGLEPALAIQVADQLMAHDALGAHARDELGITDMQRANPLQAALASAAAFSVGGIMPVLLTLFAPVVGLSRLVVITSLGSLAVTGWIAARVGGASEITGIIRMTFWGALAMALTYGVGVLVGNAG